MTDQELRDKFASEYAAKNGDDCLCARTQPGTPVGEHIYCFCGCDIHLAYQAGWDAARANPLKGATEGTLRALCDERDQLAEKLQIAEKHANQVADKNRERKIEGNYPLTTSRK